MVLTSILPTKTRDFAPQTPELEENDGDGGRHPSKITVCRTHCFDNPNVVITVGHSRVNSVAGRSACNAKCFTDSREQDDLKNGVSIDGRQGSLTHDEIDT